MHACICSLKEEVIKQNIGYNNQRKKYTLTNTNNTDTSIYKLLQFAINCDSNSAALLTTVTLGKSKFVFYLIIVFYCIIYVLFYCIMDLWYMYRPRYWVIFSNSAVKLFSCKYVTIKLSWVELNHSLKIADIVWQHPCCVNLQYSGLVYSSQ